MSEAAEQGIVGHRIAYTIEKLAMGFEKLGLPKDMAEHLATLHTFQLEGAAWWARKGYNFDGEEGTENGNDRIRESSPGDTGCAAGLFQNEIALRAVKSQGSREVT